MANDKTNGSEIHVTPRQHDVLKVLEGFKDEPKGTVTTKRIADALGITVGPVGDYLKALKEKGLVGQRSRKGKAMDGSWRLTPKGAKVL